MRLELLNGWIAYDPIEQIEGLIKRKTAYTEAVRQSRLDDAIVRLDLLLGESTIGEVWRRYDPATAHDRLNDAYEYLVSGIFAYNRAWRPWRSREQSYLTSLKWTPKTWLENMGRIVVSSTNNRAGYEERARLLRASHEELMQACQTEGLYADKPVDEAFVRNHAEPGRDWNIAEWVERHRSERR